MANHSQEVKAEATRLLQEAVNSPDKNKIEGWDYYLVKAEKSLRKEVVVDKYREKLEKELEKFKTACLAKYEKGREEHKEDLAELDIDKEIYDEMLDIINYTLIKKIV